LKKTRKEPGSGALPLIARHREPTSYKTFTAGVGINNSIQEFKDSVIFRSSTSFASMPAESLCMDAAAKFSVVQMNTGDSDASKRRTSWRHRSRREFEGGLAIARTNLESIVVHGWRHYT
jgi:hypothetical protein